jgi:hypothetical protein
MSSVRKAPDIVDSPSLDVDVASGLGGSSYEEVLAFSAACMTVVGIL